MSEPTQEQIRAALQTLTPQEAANIASHNALIGHYGLAAAWLDLAMRIEEIEPWMPAQDAPPLPEPLRIVPDLVAALSDDTAVMTVVREGSHAPTVCTALVADLPTGGDPYPCGELIRHTPANGWYHVNDLRLGESTHQAIPPR